MTKRMVAIVGLAVLASAGLPAAASAGSATLYELTENMALDDLQHPTLRTASAALQGTSPVGTPICPAALIALVQSLGLPTGASCTITAFATDELSLTTGAGTFDGRFAVVLNVDNVVDAPELVVMTGNFGADMQVLVDAKGKALPLIRIMNGTVAPVDVLGVPVAQVGVVFPGLTPEMFAAGNFGGVFRLPFAMSARGEQVKPRRGTDAFYLGDNGKKIKVRKEELSLGFPTVRVEIDF